MRTPLSVMRRIDVVLVRPRRPGNIGAAARAMKNVGVRQLILVDPCDHLAPEAQQLAYGAQELLSRARVTKSLAKAVARHRLVIGTTARTHKGYGQPALLSSMCRRILAHAQRHRIAVVFGSEQNGLANEDLALCHLLVRLPLAVTSPSYNLAQAVLLVLYELFTVAHRPPPAVHRLHAPSSELERMYAEWSTLLTTIGFMKGRQGQHILTDLRRLFSRAGLDSRDVRIVRGILRQIMWYATADLTRRSPRKD